MKRRLFLATGALCLLAARKKKPLETNNIFAPYEGSSASRLPPVRAATLPTNWRHFDVALTLKAETAHNETATLRFPLPLHQDTPTQPWQRVERLSWESDARALLERQPNDGMETLVCAWESARQPPQLLLSTALAVANRRFDISRRTFAPEREDILRKNLAATSLLPVNDTARELAKSIVKRIIDPLAQTHALHDWVIEKSVFDTTLADSDGTGDIQQQIESRQYGGGAADISGLFVLLARAIGIPARRVFGFFIAPSQLSPALGTTADASELPLLLHCRAEFYTPGYHWIPVDPAAVCRAAALDSDVADAADALNALKRLAFGFWEMNWLALNYAENETLGNLPRFLPKTDYTCQLVSRETHTE
ncbi:MAG: transglutaminase-like domain-containing protein [Betaproteobacteria bacterium]|nr:transglutaminase-like domain-containing protein [Betaproteobacteria bacterium]